MTNERDAFEKWYCDDAATVGIKMLPIEILALREGDTYGAKRIALNSKWEAWQARAAYPSTAVKALEWIDMNKSIAPVWVQRKVRDTLNSIKSTTAEEGD